MARVTLAGCGGPETHTVRPGVGTSRTTRQSVWPSRFRQPAPGLAAARWPGADPHRRFDGDSPTNGAVRLTRQSGMAPAPTCDPLHQERGVVSDLGSSSTAADAHFPLERLRLKQPYCLRTRVVLSATRSGSRSTSQQRLRPPERSFSVQQSRDIVSPTSDAIPPVKTPASEAAGCPGGDAP